jgi:hypothetical protein
MVCAACPQDVEADLAAGARGLGYFTYGWPGGVADSNAASADVMARSARSTVRSAG